MAKPAEPVDDDLEDDAQPEVVEEVQEEPAARPARAANPTLARIGIDTARFSTGDWVGFGLAGLALVTSAFTLLWMLVCVLFFNKGT